MVAVRQNSEPAGFDWTAAGARTFHIDRCAVEFQRGASLPGNNGFTYGVIAPDPSPDITETPISGMNSPFCLDGVQGNDELLRRGTRSTYAPMSDESRGGSRYAIRATVSTACAPPEADRQIGVWCITQALTWTCNRNVKRSRNRQPI